MIRRRGRRRTQLLDGLKETRRYRKLKEEALDHTLWRTRFWRGYGPVVWHSTDWFRTRRTSKEVKIQRPTMPFSHLLNYTPKYLTAICCRTKILDSDVKCVQLYENHDVLGCNTVKFGTSVPMFPRNLGRRHSTESRCIYPIKA